MWNDHRRGEVELHFAAPETFRAQDHTLRAAQQQCGNARKKRDDERYISAIAAVGARGDWRGRLCTALEKHNVDAARREIEEDVGSALNYLATIADAAGMLHFSAKTRR